MTDLDYSKMNPMQMMAHMPQIMAEMKVAVAAVIELTNAINAVVTHYGPVTGDSLLGALASANAKVVALLARLPKLPE